MFKRTGLIECFFFSFQLKTTVETTRNARARSHRGYPRSTTEYLVGGRVASRVVPAAAIKINRIIKNDKSFEKFERRPDDRAAASSHSQRAVKCRAVDEPNRSSRLCSRHLTVTNLGRLAGTDNRGSIIDHRSEVWIESNRSSPTTSGSRSPSVDNSRVPR